MIDTKESMTVESNMVALLNKGEIDQQIATAHAYPRSVKRFRDETLAMVTLTESVAAGCIYALPRDGKVIEGPSARFAEVIASAWGNCRAGARVVNEGPEFVTAQGVFHDLERNVAITYEVQRRITGKGGKKFSPDMIGVTANAACSIALRNAILKGIPKAFWSDMYDQARKTAAGSLTTLATRRADAIKAFQVYGVTEPQILATLKRPGVADITLDDLVVLRGLFTAIKEGDTTPEQAFAAPEVAMPTRKKTETAEGEPEAEKPTEAAEAVQAVLTGGQLAVIRKKLSAAGMDEALFQELYGMPLGDIPLADFNTVLTWLKSNADA
ncbi:MAG: hypothetical protein M0Z68_07960 [Gammaproteobacteria bacterium]|nr:hypothetical protein [Gammaproteobacteria bacterium]